jgi:outer membrane biosynthesis protein TonB
MGWLLRHNWLWTLLAFLLGAVITWFLLARREQSQAKVAPAEQSEEPAEEKAEELVGAGVSAASTTHAAPPRRPEPTEPIKPDEPVEPFDQEKPEPPAKPAKADRKARAAKTDTLAKPDTKAKAAKADTAAQPGTKAEAKAAPAKPDAEVDAAAKAPAQPLFSRRMDGERASAEPTLFDDHEPEPAEAQDDVVPAGRYGEGSADAVPHQGPPDGFTIKGNAQSMLFHTPDSPYYGRTKPEVWFRTEADAERAGFAKYVRKPRKSQR